MSSTESLSPEIIKQLATRLDNALIENREIQRLTIDYPKLSNDAYQVQDAGIAFRLARGEKLVGYKMGLTSEAKRTQMGLHEPIYGVLTDKMCLVDAQHILLNKWIHPKAEPEIAFLIGKDLKSPVTIEEAYQACSSICTSIEILDSRYLDFKYFSLPDVVADNSSSSAFILGKKKVKPVDFNLKKLETLEIKILVNGDPVYQTKSSAVSGNPVFSIVQLCDILSTRGLYLKAGSIVLTGAATQAVALSAEQLIEANIEKLGSVSFLT